MAHRIAFCGASGTGKSTLASYLAKHLSIPTNPVGSRSVSQAMGFASPYDVDKAGRRAEFQRRLVTEKMAWEADHESFVVDRTTMDNIAYTILHDVTSIDKELLLVAAEGLRRYTHIIYCPVEAFCDPSGDPARVQNPTYHVLYDVVLRALIDKYRSTIPLGTLHVEGLEERKLWVVKTLRLDTTV